MRRIIIAIFDAAIFYDKCAVEKLGLKAKTNFPIENYPEQLNKSNHSLVAC